MGRDRRHRTRWRSTARCRWHRPGWLYGGATARAELVVAGGCAWRGRDRGGDMVLGAFVIAPGGTDAARRGPLAWRGTPAAARFRRRAEVARGRVERVAGQTRRSHRAAAQVHRGRRARTALAGGVHPRPGRGRGGEPGSGAVPGSAG